jgi:hypothetical protein
VAFNWLEVLNVMEETTATIASTIDDTASTISISVKENPLFLFIWTGTPSSGLVFIVRLKQFNYNIFV